MSRIESEIKKLCPDGVEFRTLGDLLDYEQPGKYLVSSTNYDDSYAIPVLTAGRTFILGYTDETDGICQASPVEPVVIFDDFTTSIQWVDFPFKAKSSAMKMLRPKSGLALDLRFVYLAMQTISYRPQEHARQWIKTSSSFRVPVPPLEVQQQVVRLLDSFAALTAELASVLEGEDEARQAQHSHYRSGILGVAPSRRDRDEVALADLVEFTNGKAHERLVVADGSVALLTARFISTAGRSARCVASGNALTPAHVGDIAMVMSDLPNGRALARCFYVEEAGKYTANQRVCLLRVRDESTLSSRWLYHFLDRNSQLLAYDNGQDQTHLKKGQILDIRVPVVPLADQMLATATLDRLDGDTHNLQVVLQAERGARRLQYDYYRDRLLAFDEAIA